MKKQILLVLFSLFLFINLSFSNTYYWIGGKGNWSNTAHWSTTSGGITASALPVSNDNVVFDNNSALAISDTVFIDAPVNVNIFDFSAVVNSFVFSSSLVSIQINGDLRSNGSVIFDWTGKFVLSPISNAFITSNGATWQNDFEKIGTDTLTFNDNFSCEKDFYVDNGVFNANSKTLSFNSFYSTLPNTRNFKLSNSTIDLNGQNWNINSTTATLTHTGGTLNLKYADTTLFTGGALSYNIVKVDSGDLKVYNNNNFNYLELVNDTSSLTINNGALQQIDSLVTHGNCKSSIVIKSINPALASAQIMKTGYSTLLGSFLTINNVDGVTTGGKIYNIQISDTSNGADNWTNVGKKFYWINNTGNWSDSAHWSFASNGSRCECLPGALDSVYFDMNSFSTANQEVIIDQDIHFGYMDWSTSTNNPTLRLTYNMFSNGSVNFQPNLSVVKDNLFQRLEFNKKGVFNPNSASIACNIALNMDSPSDTLLLGGYFHMLDSTVFYQLCGKFLTQGNNITASSIQIVDTSAARTKYMNLSSSTVTLSAGFNSEGITSNFTFESGTSNLSISSNNLLNYLTTEGLTFNNVTLKFPKLISNISPYNPVPQRIAGDNSFKKLTILKKSYIQIDSNSVQTIDDTLIVKGTCKDSIFLFSNNPTLPASFSKTSGALSMQYVNLKGIKGLGGATHTAYFSKNAGNNTNWTFNTTKEVASAFTITGSHCYGDTMNVNNTTVAFSGNSSDLSTKWYFGDRSTYYYVNPPTDSTIINYISRDTTKHRFTASGDVNVMLVSTNNLNGCTDTARAIVHINKPLVYVIPSASVNNVTICAGDSLKFDISSNVPNATFETFLNNISQNTPSVNDTIFKSTSFNNLDTVKFIAYENGCASDSIPFFAIKVKSLPIINWTSNDADTAICIGNSVTFTSTGTGLYQYFVNGGSVTNFIKSGLYTTTGLANGDQVTVIGKDTLTNCMNTTQAMIYTVNPLPLTTLSESTGSNTICVGDAVTFTAAGASTYQFFVDGVAVSSIGGNTWTTSTLTTGKVVSVIGYSSTGCIKTAPQTFTYTVNQLPNATLTSTDADASICSGTPVTFNASGGALYQYFINGISQGAQSSTSTLSTSSLTNGNSVTVEVEFSGCKKVSTPIVFTVLSSPTTTLVSSDLDASICAGTSVTFTAGGASTYQFFVNGVSQGSSSATNTFTTSSLINGQTVRVTGTSNTCPVSSALTFTVLSLPTVPLFSNDPDNTICFGDPITLTSANCSTYELFANNVSQGLAQVSQTFNPSLAAGSNALKVIGTGANGCSTTSSILTVQVNSIPSVTLSSTDIDNTICAGESVTFSGAGSTNYQFFINGIPQGSLSPTATLTTSNLLNGQIISMTGSTLGCASNSNTLTFTVNSIPSVSLSSSDANNVFCEGDAVTLTAAGATSYQFLLNNVVQGLTSTTNTYNASTLTAGTYTLQVVGYQNNCSRSASNTLIVNGLPTATLTSNDADNIICSGQNVTYTSTGGSLYLFKIDNVNQGSASPLSTISFSNLVNGNVISVVVSTPEGCLNSASVAPITVNTTPTATISSSDVDHQICIGDNVTFSSTGASNYEFFVNNVSQGAASTSSSFSSSSLADNDVIKVTLTTLGCSATSTPITFTVHNYPTVTLTNNGGNQLCTGASTNLTALGANNYQFAVNGSTVGAFSTSNTFSAAVNNGDVISVSGETFGCISNASSSITFIVNTYPTISAISSDADNVICLNDNINFTTTGATTYTYQLNGTNLQTGTTGTYSLNTLQNNDVISVTGYNGTCASTPTSFTFTVHSMNLGLSASPSNLICSGDAVSFTATGANQYQFFVNGISQGALSNQSTFNSSTLNNLDQITFTGYSTTTQCTQNYADFINMNVIAQPTITASNTTFCQGDSVILYSNSSTGNQWLLNGSPISGATDTAYIVQASGNYSLETTHGGLGSIWSFGQNASGTIGDGTNINTINPTQANTALNFEDLSSGSDFVIGLTSLGNVYSWGDNSSGQLGNGTYTATNSPIQVPTLASIKTIATTEMSAMAVTQTGGAYVWGNNTLGQLSTGNTSVINFPYLNPSLTNIDSIAGGRNHFVILKNDGTVWAVGNNDYGQLGTGNQTGSMSAQQVSGLSNIVSVGAGEYNSFAINAAGDLYVWGNNGAGQLGLNDITNRLTPTLSSLKNITNAQGGANHSVFLTSSNTVYTSGNNTFGQLGTGNNSESLIPTLVGLNGISQISAGQYTTILKKLDNSVYGFGSTIEGQLATTSVTSINVPTQISNLYGVGFVESGKTTTYCIYQEEQACSTSGTTITMLSSLPVTITENNGVLSTVSGDSYQWYLNGFAITSATNQSLTITGNGFYSVSVTYSSGCVGTSPDFAYNVVGIDELSSNISIFPNPTNGLVTISTNRLENGTSTIQVKDLSGRIVLDPITITSATSQVDLFNLNEGMYIIEIVSNNTILSRKSIVKKN